MKPFQLIAAFLLVFASLALAATPTPDHYIDGTQVSNGQSVSISTNQFQYKIVLHNPMVCTFRVTARTPGIATGQLQINASNVGSSNQLFETQTPPVTFSGSGSGGGSGGGSYFGNSRIPPLEDQLSDDSLPEDQTPPREFDPSLFNGNANSNSSVANSDQTPSDDTSTQTNPLTGFATASAGNAPLAGLLLIIAAIIAFFGFQGMNKPQPKGRKSK